MRESYLSKNNQLRQAHHLPQLKSRKRNPNIPHSLTSLAEPDEKTLLRQINDIDASLNSKQLTYHAGNLFSCQVTDKLLNELHLALTKKGMILEDGFDFLNASHQESKAKPANRIETFNEKMGNLSMKNVYDYDLNKYHMLMKNNRNRWSLFKRTEQKEFTQAGEKRSIQSSPPDPKTRRVTEKSQGSLSNMSQLKPSQADTILSLKSHFKDRKKSQFSSQEKQSPLNFSRLETSQASNELAKLISPSKFKDDSAQRGHKKSFRRKILTEISELDDPEANGEMISISKYEIKNILKRETNLVVIWLPPASYPHFNGVFTYSSGRSLATCRLKKYFLYRRSLNTRLFGSVLKHLSFLQNRYIESLELLTNKHDYHKIFEPMGWKLKSMEGMDKLLIKFSRKEA